MPADINDDDYEEVQVPASASSRRTMKGESRLRACLQCNLVMTEDQFLKSGCINCTDLQLDNNRDAVLSNTTTNFKGLAVVMKPEISWVARFNDISGAPGAYAINTNQ